MPPPDTQERQAPPPPGIARPRITSLDLHLDFAPGAIVETLRVEDSACGCHPCYYRRLDDRLRVSTSAVALVADVGDLRLNPAFQPPDFLRGRTGRGIFVDLTGALPGPLKERLKSCVPLPLLERLARGRFWYESWETIDTRIHKLRPFERVTADAAESAFHPDFSLTDPDELVDQVAIRMTLFVRDIEERHPRHAHVLMLGGLDSLLLALVPKRHPSSWHVFSAAPNAPLVRKWLARNNVAAGEFFTHDSRNEETPAETQRKIVCSDLYSDPRHLRWLPALGRLAERWPDGCIFWAGTAPCGLHEGRRHYRHYRGAARARFFGVHLTRVPSLMGSYHQVVKNFTGCALLSPYQSAEIWRHVYMRYGPEVIPPGVDLRPQIGERLAGRRIHWPAGNPGPQRYLYTAPVNAREIYLRHIHERLHEAAR